MKATFGFSHVNPLTWKIWWVPNNANRWLTGFNTVFRGLSMMYIVFHKMCFTFSHHKLRFQLLLQENNHSPAAVQLAIQYSNKLIHRRHTITRTTTISPFELSQLCCCTCKYSSMWRRVSYVSKDRSASIFKAEAVPDNSC